MRHNAGLLFSIYVIVGKFTTWKHYYIVHSQTMLVLDLMHINEGNARVKISQWGVRNLHSMNELEYTLMFPYNERSHQSFFILEYHHTSHFDSIPKYHNTWKANQFVKCAVLKCSYTKGISHNSNDWAIIGIRPIVHIPLPPQNGTWECDTQLQNIFVNT